MNTVGRFQLVRELGAGGFGTVYEGVEPVSGVRVAIKVLGQRGGTAASVRAQLLAEVDALRVVDSPHALRVIDVVDEGGVLALVTDLVAGVPLRSILDEHVRLSGQHALSVLYGAGQGLAAVHAAGLVHGDVKPANILIEPSGNSRLIDFGLASLPGWIAEDSGSPWGSPAYAPPEQVLHEYRDHRSDIYSLTVTLYEVLCGQRPFVGGSIEQVRHQHAYEPLPDPRTFVPDLGDGLTQLLMWGLAKDPADRPQEVETWLEYLTAAAAAKYGPGWASAAGVGAVAGSLLAGGLWASGALGGASAATGIGVAAGLGAPVSAGASAVGAGMAGLGATTAGSVVGGSAATTTAGGTGLLSTVAGKAAVGVLIAGVVAGGMVAATNLSSDKPDRTTASAPVDPAVAGLPAAPAHLLIPNYGEAVQGDRVNPGASGQVRLPGQTVTINSLTTVESIVDRDTGEKQRAADDERFVVVDLAWAEDPDWAFERPSVQVLVKDKGGRPNVYDDVKAAEPFLVSASAGADLVLAVDGHDVAVSLATGKRKEDPVIDLMQRPGLRRTPEQTLTFKTVPVTVDDEDEEVRYTTTADSVRLTSYLPAELAGGEGKWAPAGSAFAVVSVTGAKGESSNSYAAWVEKTDQTWTAVAGGKSVEAAENPSFVHHDIAPSVQLFVVFDVPASTRSMMFTIAARSIVEVRDEGVKELDHGTKAFDVKFG